MTLPQSIHHVYQTFSYGFVTSLDSSIKLRKVVLMDGTVHSASKETEVERCVLPA